MNQHKKTPLTIFLHYSVVVSLYACELHVVGIGYGPYITQHGRICKRLPLADGRYFQPTEPMHSPKGALSMAVSPLDIKAANKEENKQLWAHR